MTEYLKKITYKKQVPEALNTHLQYFIINPSL